MSQKSPFRGTERTFFPLRDLREGGIFIAKGQRAKNKRRFSLSFHPIIRFCCTLLDPQSEAARTTAATAPPPQQPHRAAPATA